MIDTHAHILDERFDGDRDAVRARAAAAGVTGIIEIAWNPALWRKALDQAARDPSFRCVLGFHPQDAATAHDAAFLELERACAHPAVVGIGETGLDYHHGTSPRDVQATVFRRHIVLARSMNKPLVIHCRDAYADLCAILEQEAPQGPTPFGVVHCFSGTLPDALRLTAMGCLLGIDGPVTYPSAQALRDVVIQLPLRALVVETDCPYLPPQSSRGKRNEPAYLVEIIREIARLKDIPATVVADATAAAARHLFRLPEEIPWA